MQGGGRGLCRCAGNCPGDLDPEDAPGPGPLPERVLRSLADGTHSALPVQRRSRDAPWQRLVAFSVFPAWSCGGSCDLAAGFGAVGVIRVDPRRGMADNLDPLPS